MLQLFLISYGVTVIYKSDEAQLEDLYNPVRYNTSDNDLQETVTQNDERKH